MPTTLGKTERTLHERRDEHAFNDKDSAVFNHLNASNGVQYMFDIGKLAPSLFTNNLIDYELDLRSTRINLVQMNTQIIDRHKNCHPVKKSIGGIFIGFY